MKNSVCTIVTEDYIPFAASLHESLIKVSVQVPIMYVLVYTESGNFKEETGIPGIHFLSVNDLCRDGISMKIKSKYFNENVDCFRWSMKPVLINYLIKEGQFEKVVFLDCDLNFFSDPGFIFDKLDQSNILVSPHWRSSDPHADKINFELQYNTGLFNGGFVGVNRHATAAMDWWAMACEYACEVNSAKGFFVDQTHLNLLPVFFDKVEILNHRGCNVANWNQIECKRVPRQNGEVWINDEFPIVFIHFTGSTIRGIVRGDDHYLTPHLNVFSESLTKNGWRHDVIKNAQLQIRNRRKKKKSLASKIKSKLRGWLK